MNESFAAEKYVELTKGKFTITELKHLYQLFSFYASSGYMHFREFQLYLAESHCTGGNAGGHFEHLFRAYDVDGDGVISFQDYLIYHLGVIFCDINALCSIVFAAFDADCDGLITLSEMFQVVLDSTCLRGECDPLNVRTINEIYTEIGRIWPICDRSRKGVITREDLAQTAVLYPEVLVKLRNLC